MNKILSILIAVNILIGHANASTASETSKSITGTQVISGHFGLFNPDDPAHGFTPSDVVPLVENQSYGWVIRLRTNKSTVKWREEFVLPEKPDTWGSAQAFGKHSISPNGRVSITEREVTPEKGMIFNVWTVAPGDPKGKYIIRVFVEGRLVKTFRFDVQ